jgi:RND family efflux transporter MFP subunit
MARSPIVRPHPQSPRLLASAVRSSVLLGLLGLIGACASGERRHGAVEAAPVRVKVEAAHEEPLAVIYRASGTVRGRNTAVVSSKTTGYVRAIRVRPGDEVKAGQVLADLEANDVRASVARARAGLDRTFEARVEAENALEAARIAASSAKTNHERSTKLLADRAISQQQYDDEETSFRSAVANEAIARARLRAVTSGIEEAKAGLAESQATLGYAQIVAPFAGRILERRVDSGALASPGMPLLVIADEGTLRVEAAVEESHAADVKVGDEVTVEIDGVKPVTGKVGEIVPNVDAASRAFLVKVDLPDAMAPVRSGTFARVGFGLGTRPRLVVPTTAVTTFGALDRVFVADGNAARLRMITRGEAQGAWTEVLSGLTASENVVAAPPAELRDGARIELAR